MWSISLFSGGLLEDVDAFAILAPADEFHDAVFRGEDRIVTSAHRVGSGINFCAPLPIDDRAGMAPLAIGEFGAEPLRVGIAPVTGRTNALLRGELLDI